MSSDRFVDILADEPNNFIHEKDANNTHERRPLHGKHSPVISKKKYEIESAYTPLFLNKLFCLFPNISRCNAMAKPS